MKHDRKYPHIHNFVLDYTYWKYIELFSNPKYHQQIPKELLWLCKNSKSEFIRWLIDRYAKRFQRRVS